MRSFHPLFALILILSSLALAAPAVADDTAPEEAAPTLQETGAPSLCPALAAAAPKAEPLAAASFCNAVAECGQTTVSCEDTTNPAECQAVDQDCDNGVRGYVQCNGEPRIYCPICEDCTGVKQCNPCGNAQPRCGCFCVRGACGRIDAWVCL